MKILMLGLNDAGKSTYLAALYYTLTNPDELEGPASKLYKLSGDEKYIINLRNKWLSFEPIGRTNISDDPTETVFHIEDKNKEKFDLIVPDLSGEVFKRMLEIREDSPNLREQILNADGFLVFINCANYKRAVSILSINDEDDKAVDEIDKTKKKIWDHSDVPTQVKMVELLQFLKIIKDSAKPIKISLILSAWDEVKAGFDTPELCLKSQFPLLQQFLDSNLNSYSYNLFGVSAQGIGYNKSTNKEDLVSNFDSTISRISVIYKGKVSHDISFPINILMEAVIE